MPKFSIGYIHCVCLYKIEWDFLTTKASIYIYIVQSTDKCFAVPQLISVAWYNLVMAWQLFIPQAIVSDNSVVMSDNSGHAYIQRA